MEGQAPAREGQAGLKAYFLRERPMLLRLLSARLGNPEEAEDVLQDVWLRLETMTSPPIAQPGGYLFRIANNIAIDRRRAAAFRQKREGRWAEAHDSDGVTATSEETLIASDRLRQIDAIVAALPERTARIFRLSRYEHLQRRAIADMIGISVSAVEKHLQNAFRAIHHLSEDSDGQTVAGSGSGDVR